MGGYKKWSTNDVLTAADLNAYCSNQSVMVFASAAARDAAITGANKIDGMVVYLATGDSGEGLYTYNGSSWTKGAGWNAPVGVRSVRTDGTDRTVATTSMAELTTSLRTSETFIANRYLRFTFEASLAQTSAGTGFVAEVYNVTAGTTVRRIAQFNDDVGTGFQVAATMVAASAAGAVYTIRMQGVTHSVSVQGSSVQSTRFSVEDIGPNGAPV